MTDKDFLKRAMALAEQSAEPVKCGVVIVMNGEVVGEAFNSQRADNQATNHAEIKAIRMANEKVGNRILEGAVAYGSCEPCAMCLTALSLAQVERIVFAQSLEELANDDPMSQIDTTGLATQLNFVPKLEHLVLS